MAAVHAIDTRRELTRRAVAEDVLKLIEQRGVEHRDLRSLFHVALSSLQQACDVRAGKTFAAPAREIIPEVEPLLAARHNLHARRHAFDIARDVPEPLAHSHLPLALKPRQMAREEAENPALAPQDEFALRIRPVEAARIQPRHRRLLCGAVAGKAGERRAGGVYRHATFAVHGVEPRSEMIQ